jgi:hypothetical protein
MKRIIGLFLAVTLLFTISCAFAEATWQDVIGVVEDGDYKNTYAGFGFHLGDWQVASETDIASVYEKSEDYFTEDFSKAMEARDSLCFFMAIADEGKESAMSVITNEGAAAGLYHALGFRTMYRMEAAKLKKNLESYGITVVSMEVGSITVDGREMACMRIEESLDGVSMCVIEVSLIKGPYRIDIGASSTDFDSAEAIMARFFWL